MQKQYHGGVIFSATLEQRDCTGAITCDRGFAMMQDGAVLRMRKSTRAKNGFVTTIHARGPMTIHDLRGRTVACEGAWYLVKHRATRMLDWFDRSGFDIVPGPLFDWITSDVLYKDLLQQADQTGEE